MYFMSLRDRSASKVKRLWAISSRWIFANQSSTRFSLETRSA